MPLSWNDIRSNALKFSREWAGETNERAEASTFWNEFFEVFGVSRRRVSVFEKHITKAGGQAGYIDLFWPKVLIAEHKSLGKDLDRAFSQAIDYFPGLNEAELPRYVVVSDFARFRVHDLETDESTEVALEDLHENVHVFSFIAGYQVRTFREQDPVNLKAADKLARLHDRLLEIGYAGHDLEVYLVRLLFCLFAEDTGIFMPRGMFHDFIEQRTSVDGSDLAARLNELFEVLNTPDEKRLKARDEQLNDFPYVNGGLFSERLATAAFDRELRQLLIDCCDLDWGQVSPAIFGSLFQGIMDADMRRNLGAHYTSEQNIMKVIGPLFLDDLKEELAKCGKSRTKLEAFHRKLASLHFFDPACGCGNFLVITYREIRLLELEIIRRLHGKQGQALELLDVIDQYVQVNVDQFHGIEIEEWPAQIARVAMWLIDHQMNELVGEELGNTFVRIPLVKSANIVHGNALQMPWEEILPPTQCSYLFGNPPFLGHHYQSAEQKADHAQNMAEAGVQGAGVIDFVANWHVRSVPYLQQNPRIRAALVSTNSITQGEQAGILWSWLMERGVRINFAHRTFQWTSEARGVAAVHCVIVGYALHDAPQKLIFEYDTPRSDPHAIKAANINPYLADGPDVLVRNRRKPINDVPLMRWGNKPTDGGNLIMSPEEKDALVAAEPDAIPYVRRFMSGGDFINDRKRYCLWLTDITPQDLRKLKLVRERVEAVREFRQDSKAAATRRFADYPTLFRQIAQPDTNYLAIPEVSSERREYIPIAFFSPEVICSNKVQFVPDATPYHFGILMSSMHMAWTRAVCGRMKSDYSYSNSIVYNNFPWPEASEAQQKKIEATGQAILEARSNHPGATLADLYDPLSMPVDLRKAHEANDKAVDAAYGRRRFKAEAERVGYLFELYQQRLEDSTGRVAS
ncbi:class I SAM-dependent DNA methyltransferase [Chromohalobacter israelensis]|uniref:class I SAM-dependent DNA methyltransferase n=1 Tax=Chromohalobacter israelensis TaxID=141390 RepID=UPI00055224BD|nr:DNA methyltransferase [Chromohalobacter israelensis]MDF9435886.1 class I SAM-dependent DNA methyltransferase [Chromohalobacter israelensis]